MKNPKPILITVLVFLILSGFLFASSSSAQTAPNLQSIIKQLQEQIKLLNQQILDLQSRVKETEKEIQIVKSELKLTRSLRKGESSDEVKQLQEFLKQFPDIYPEGIVTGFFGSLTEIAVKRFQQKHGIESIGIVGPKTIQKLNEFSVSATPAIPAIPAIPGVSPALPAIPASPSLPLIAFTPLAQPATVSAVVPTSIPSALASPSSTPIPITSYSPTSYENRAVRITSSASHKTSTAISGDRIVWSDNRSLYWEKGNWDIYMYDLATKTEKRITSLPGDEKNPDISGNYVVYEASGGIYLYNISTGATTKIGSGRHPKINSNSIVYASSPQPPYYIYYYDIASGRTKTISTKGDSFPDISGNDVAYAQYTRVYLPGNTAGGTKLHYYNLAVSQEREILSGKHLYRPSVFNGRLAYSDTRDAYNEVSNVYVYDLNANTEKRLTDRPGGGGGKLSRTESVSTSGDRVYWIDIEPYRIEGNPTRIFFYDLLTNQPVQVTSGSSNVKHLSVDAGRLVWLDDRHTDRSTGIMVYDIYYLDLSETKSPAPAPTPILASTPIPAPTSTSAPTVSTSPSPTASVSYSPTLTPTPIPTPTPTSTLPSNLVSPSINPFRWGSQFNGSNLSISGSFQYSRTADSKALNVYVQYPDQPGTFTKYTYSIPVQDYLTVSGNDGTTLRSDPLGGVTSWQWSIASRPANTFSLGTYRFYVTALGTDDKEGPKSALFENTLSVAPAITSPANGATAAFPITIILGQTKAGEYYKYTIWGGSTMYYESSYTQNASITVNSVPYLVNGNTYQISVSSYDNSSGGSSINKQPTVESSFILGIPTPTPTPTPTPAPTPIPTPAPTSSISFSPSVPATANVLETLKAVLQNLNNLLFKLR